MRPIGGQNDDLRAKLIQAGQVAGDQMDPAARVHVQRQERGDGPGVPPLGDLAPPGAECRHPLVFGIAHGKAPARQRSDGLRLGELAGTLAAPSQRLHVPQAVRRTVVGASTRAKALVRMGILPYSRSDVRVASSGNPGGGRRWSVPCS